MSRRRPRRWPWLVPLLLAAFLLVLRAFVGNVYRVSTPSMRPTLAAGDGESVYVAVRYGAPEPLQRFALCVFRQPGKRAPAIKRLAALPGESVQIANGDLWIDGRLLGPEVSRPPEIPVFDSEREGWGERFTLKGEGCPGGAPGPWRPLADGAEGWRLDALSLGPEENVARMFLVPDVTTSGLVDLSADPQWLQVGDLAARVRVHLVDAPVGARVMVELREAADVFRASLVREEAGFVPWIERSSSGAPFERLQTGSPLALRAPGEHELFFRNRDDTLEFVVDGEPGATVAYDRNRAYPAPTPEGVRSLGPRLGVGGSGVVVDVKAIALARDLAWSSAEGLGEFATRRSLQLGPDEVFLLGDNTLDSTDGRFFGPTSIDELSGRPVAVVWPPSKWTWLR